MLIAEADTDMIAVSTKVKKKKKKTHKSKSGHPMIVEGVASSSSPPPQPSGREEQDLSRGSMGQEEHRFASRPDGDKMVSLKESASSSSSRLSLDSMTDEGSTPMFVALATASQLVSGEAMAAANATALVLSASSGSIPAPSTSPPAPPTLPSAPSPDMGAPAAASDTLDVELPRAEGTDVQESCPHRSPDHSPSPSDEMRSAMLALSKMKDELESENRWVSGLCIACVFSFPSSLRVLSSQVTELQEEVKQLKEELRQSEEELSRERGAQSSHKVALERENDLLREQLKKYVNIVQAQRKESSSASESSGMSRCVSDWLLLVNH